MQLNSLCELKIKAEKLKGYSFTYANDINASISYTTRDMRTSAINSMSISRFNPSRSQPQMSVRASEFRPEDELQTRVRRNRLLRLISDPKSYYTAFLGSQQQMTSHRHDSEGAVTVADDRKELDTGSTGGFCSSRQIGE